MGETDKVVQGELEAAADSRRPWIEPELRIIRAGSAEAGPNPNNAEGVFGKGS